MWKKWGDMELSSSDLFHLILAILILIAVSHVTAFFFKKMHLPEVVGEITAGILLGPTLLQTLAPEWFDYFFRGDQSTTTVMAVIYQIGILHLLFVTGIETNLNFSKSEIRTALYIAFFGAIVPFCLTVAVLPFIDISHLVGKQTSLLPFYLVFATGVAFAGVTIISRVLLDLKILKTSFAKIIFAIAVFEDVVLCINLSVALSAASASEGRSFGLPALLDLDKYYLLSVVYYVLITILFFVISILFTKYVINKYDLSKRFSIIRARDPLAFLLTILLVMTSLAISLGIAPIFGAFVGGIVASEMKKENKDAIEAFKVYSNGFFIPIYFAIIGLRLDLIHHLDWKFCIIFIVVATLVKALGVVLGSRMAKEKWHASANFAIALNARGAPGIILAALALDAHIISKSFYTTLVVFTLVTSLIAGAILTSKVNRGVSLR